MIPEPRVERDLVGRAQQLRIVDHAIAGVAEGRGQVLLVSGEAGIGKTRLARAAVDRARAAGMRTAWAAAWQGDGAPPLWPWAVLMRQLTGAEVDFERDLPSSPEGAAAARFHQFESVARAICDTASRSPVLLVLDDLHWADVASVRLLDFVAAALPDCACVMVATYRPAEMDRSELTTLARLGTTLPVPGLDVDSVHEMLTNDLGTGVSTSVAATIRARTGGNPLFVRELAGLMTLAGRVDVAPASVPGAVTAVIQRRLAFLTEASVAMLQAAAVLGHDFTTEGVAEVVDAPLDEVDDALEPAIRAGLLIEWHGHVAFGHDLIRQVVLESMSASRRAGLHRRAAALLAGRVEEDPSLHATIADHLARAGPDGAADASQHWQAAAQRALDVLAYEEAATCFGRARAVGVHAPSRHAELLAEEGNALLRAGDLLGARARFAECAVAARTSGRADLLAEAAQGMGTGSSGFEVPLWSADQVNLVHDALALLPREDTAMRSRLLARLSVTAATPGKTMRARALAEEALELAEETGEPQLVAQALAALNDALGGPDHVEERRANAEQIVALAREAGDLALELLGHRFLVVVHAELGDFAAHENEVETFARLADRLRQPLVGWYTPLFRGARALLHGSFAEAERRQEEVAAAAATTGSVNAALLSATQLLCIRVDTNREPPDGFLDIVDMDPAEWASYASGLAFAAAQAGELEKARSLLDLHAADHFARIARDSEFLVTCMLFDRVATAVGDDAALRDLRTLLLPYEDLWLVDGISACIWGPVQLELGRIAFALGEHEEARRRLIPARRAVERADALPRLADIEALEERLGPATPAEPIRAQGSTGNVFRREGEIFSIEFEGTVVRAKDSKGLRDLARLLSEPGREVHVLDLVGAGEVAPAGDAGEVIDARARAEYRRRLEDLEADIADATDTGDRGRLARLQAERDFLIDELSSALGLGGRPRRAGEVHERARKAVSARIRLAIDRLGADHPALRRHLTNSVQTGTFCCYRPERPMTWTM
jgi:hypothetical protein